MNWQRGRWYGQELRDKMFAAIDRGIEPAAVATAFTVSVSWIYKAIGRRRETGETTARPQRCHVAGKLAAYHAEIRAQVTAVADMTIATYGVSVSHAVMWETLRRLKLTRKKRPDMRPSRSARTSQPHARSGELCSQGCIRRSWSSSMNPPDQVRGQALGDDEHVPTVWPNDWLLLCRMGTGRPPHFSPACAMMP